MNARVLIVDDEPSIRKVLAAHLGRMGYDVATAQDGAEAISALEDDLFHVVVSDMQMPVVNGLDLLRWVREHQPGLPLILITAHGTVDSAVQALKDGAFDYISKPFDQDELQASIAKALATERRNTHHATADPGERGIVGETPIMRGIYQLVEKVAPSPTTVLITGESGTGKELIARAIHEGSPRANAPFIQINCGAIPENLFEAELFGFERGAFTGAVHDKPGRFELAHGGTLFLDEVGELPREMQVKILRALQERCIDRVGGLRPIDVDVRVVAATNADLQAEVKAGTFREDLYYRLNVVPIHLPPLRERSADIPLLAQHFIGRFNQRLDKQVKQIAPDAMATMLAHGWPGNIRELENLMERSVLLSDDDTLRIHDLIGLTRAAEMVEGVEEHEELGLKEYVRVHTVKLERARIGRVLEATDGNVTRAARRLGISRKSLQTKMKDYGLRER